MDSAVRHCSACTRRLVRKRGEHPSAWNRRVVCDTKCRALRINSKVPREVPCLGGCGTLLIRRRAHKAARCHKCKLKWRVAYFERRRREIRLQARRYRVLMTALGWDDFDELLEYLRGVPWADVGGVRRRDLKLVQEVRDVG